MHVRKKNTAKGYIVKFLTPLSPILLSLISYEPFQTSLHVSTFMYSYVYVCFFLNSSAQFALLYTLLSVNIIP